MFNEVNSRGDGWDMEDGDWYASTLIAQPLEVGRYFVYLLFRQRGDKGPLRRSKRACTVNVAIIVGNTVSKAGNKRYQVSFDRDQILAYVGDFVVRSDGGAEFSSRSPEGTAYLDDQIAHTAVE
jgi:hypothetical protein